MKRRNLFGATVRVCGVLAFLLASGEAVAKPHSQTMATQPMATQTSWGTAGNPNSAQSSKNHPSHTTVTNFQKFHYSGSQPVSGMSHYGPGIKKTGSSAYAGHGSNSPCSSYYVGPHQSSPCSHNISTPIRTLNGSHYIYAGHSYARFTGPHYVWPHGYSYTRYQTGGHFPHRFWNRDYYIYDYASFNLEAPPPDFQWVRYGPDLVLIDLDSGEIARVVYGAFDDSEDQ